MNLGLYGFELVIRSDVKGFKFVMSFRLDAVGKDCTTAGTAPSIDQCFEAAMSMLANKIRDAVEA